MKVALISYHSNIGNLYPEEWITRHRESIITQSYNKFKIYELDYGARKERIFQTSRYLSKKFPTFIHAMNYLLDKLFFELDYDAVANTNCDDWYDKQWLKTQLPYLDIGYDLVSSNFALVKDDKEILRHGLFHHMNIAGELKRGNNIIAHPAVIFSKRFWLTNRYDPEEIPYEDMKLWQRAINNGYRFKIVPECLLFHRLHHQSVCQSENR